MAFSISTTAFGQGGVVPKQHTADGRNTSPTFTWRDPPAGTVSFAMLGEDPDAPKGTFTHWIVFDLPPETRALPEGVTSASLPDGAKHGTNSFGTVGYRGPDPPPGKPHRYFFKLLALDRRLDLTEGADRARFLAATSGHVLGEAQWMGKYGR